jgi:hypothetical protein
MDWQNASYGPPMHDVAFLLLTSLPPETRKSHHNELLTAYWKAFEVRFGFTPKILLSFKMLSPNKTNPSFINVLQETAAHFYLKMSWAKSESYRSYQFGLLYACIVLSSSAFPEILPKDDEDRVTAIVDVIRELIAAQII